MDAYHDYLSDSKWVALVGSAFHSDNLAENRQFKDAPANLDRGPLLEIAGFMDEDDIKAVVAQAQSF